ncbi:lipoprotein signal peptidase, partial [Campylobacter jejuni]
MAKTFKFIFYFWGAFVLVFALDQWVKSLTLAGFRWQSEYLDLTY